MSDKKDFLEGLQEFAGKRDINTLQASVMFFKQDPSDPGMPFTTSTKCSCPSCLINFANVLRAAAENLAQEALEKVAQYQCKSETMN
jgi:hypothetical protein